MGLINKLKNILFEEEEIEIPVLEKKQVPKKEIQPVRNETIEEKSFNENNYYNNLKPAIEEETRLEESQKKEVVRNTPSEIVSDRDMFRSDKTFNFPAFDEEEFESIKTPPRKTNVLTKQNTPRPEKKTEYRRIEKKEETQKFKPSPIISPVYGILDKNYTPEEITSKSSINKRLDVDTVRKKAFGNSPKKEEEKDDVIIKNYQDYDDKILEEKLEKARTIDELLKDSSDEVITLREDKDTSKEEIKEELPEDTLESDAITSIDELKSTDDGTLESDLFDLIDSMYENREEGE